LSSSEPLNLEKIGAFVVAWYVALDIHAPIQQCYDLLADEGLTMRFPDGDIHDLQSFKVWYDRVTNIFFDESHNVQSVKAAIHGDEADLDVVVGWQASWFENPAAQSKRTAMDATQKWKVRRSAKNDYGMEIVFYNATAEPFKYAPGFAHLGLDLSTSP
jgi:hypothetical protein